MSADDKGTVCLSYDFELAWGSRASSSRTYGQKYEQTWDTIPKLLSILDKYDIPSSWATVGALLCTEDYDFSALREVGLSYPWFEGDWYDIPAYSEAETRKRFYGPELVEQIVNATSRQEIECHTFTHVYAAAPETSPELFDLELKCCRELEQRWGLEKARCVVFPRNMVACHGVLKENGYTGFRSINTEWFWFGHRFPTSMRDAKGWKKLFPLLVYFCRYLDEQLAFTPPVFSVSEEGGLAKVSHGSFLPGFSGVSKYVSGAKRSKRIAKGARAAARKKKSYSIYFHPHNFNYRRDECLTFFDAICRELAELREQDRIDIVTLRDLVETDEVEE